MDLSINRIRICPLLQIEISAKNLNKIVKSVEHDEMAHNEPSHQDVHCLPFCFDF